MCISLKLVNSMALKRVLSIQSHVVSGYVGNKAATFPLQVLGYDVDAINSVQLTCHTGYEFFPGQVLQAEELKVLFEGLRLNNIHKYSHLLTGYCGSESFLKEVLDVLKQVKEANPSLIYVCDPVLGDNGVYYVPESLLPIYRDELVPFSDIITPNQFEAELLTGTEIKTELDALSAISLLHKKGPKTVVLTSCVFTNSDKLILLASTKDKPNEYIRMEVPKIDAVFLGTGDLFTSLFLAWYDEYPTDIKTACENTMSALQQILEKTLAHANNLAGEGKKPTVAQIELRLVQSLDIIRAPTRVVKAELICI